MQSPLSHPTEFLLFPRLPLEIRLEIWAYASFLPRNVDIWPYYLGGPLTGPFHNFYPHHFVSNNGIPGLLHACAESRTVGLQHYVLGFGTCEIINGFSFQTPARIYVNPIVDRVVEMDRTMNRRIEPVRYFWEKCREMGVSRIALRISEEINIHEIYDIKAVLDHALELTEVVLFESREYLDIKGVINFVEVDERFGDVDDERKTLFLRVASVMQGDGNGLDIEPEGWEEGQLARCTMGESDPRARFAHVYVDGARR
jgi:hypothetical protein